MVVGVRVSAQALPYRLCAGVVMVNRAGLIFAARRLDSSSSYWQMPQGGVERGEAPLAAALRELREETGVRSVSVVAESRCWRRYDIPEFLQKRLWGGRYRGQNQKWFAARFAGDDDEINLATEHPEFCRWRWVEALALPGLAVPFKRALYRDVLLEFGALGVLSMREPSCLKLRDVARE